MKNPFKDILKSEPIQIVEPENKPPKPIHQHEWEVVSKTYASPVKNIALNQNGQEKDLLEKTLFGVTVILWNCMVCKDFRKEEMLGSDENMLDELIAKAEEYGPQFIDRDGKIYVVAKYQAPPVAPTNIPVR